ncbi:MAG TPA: four helix bundle protein [Candidatus Didemnitutus sp.]|nr:four helix bundle protein [Candidatus Didemnitutus sp.]
METETKNFDLEERLLKYSAAVIRLTEGMRRTPAGPHVAGQLLRSGTSPLPNHGEAQAAESPADFVHKMSICLKELRETRRWLRLVQTAELIKVTAAADPVVRETEELIRIFYSSISTARKRRLLKGRSSGC